MPFFIDDKTGTWFFLIQIIQLLNASAERGPKRGLLIPDLVSSFPAFQIGANISKNLNDL